MSEFYNHDRIPTPIPPLLSLQKDRTEKRVSEPLWVQRLSPAAIMPFRAHETDAGYDLTYSRDEVLTVPSCGGRVVVPLDIAFTVPLGTYGRIAPRSGLAAKNGIDIGAGVIDRGYTGMVSVVVFNHNLLPFQITKGMKIAQLVLEKIETADVVEVESLDNFDRGTFGFGSSDGYRQPEKVQNPYRT
jgi:dUTP pyrophosphatase